ncbi:receptor-like protein 12 [Pyrus ussuriensis x Pyrus communis]|uniref:Receptor-like protein 12 n=1 Tax=Pyrus ussuriensis x Pyrus communis TaxID=2448454 RepID=A0A5N5FBR1_9ROSA|nr:receptor-like protein 12 [Pyrus ussuriensis x Pyrus communis]
MEKITLETKGKVSRLCSLIGSLQRRLDLEYSTPKNGYAGEMMEEVSPEKEPVIPLFPLLEEKKDKGKKTRKDLTLGKLLLEKPEVNMMINTDPFPKAPINMINLTWAKKRKGKTTWEVKVERRQLLEKPKATIIKGLLEVPTSRAIIDQKLIKKREIEEQEACRSIMRATENETSRNVFQRLGGDFEPKNLSEVFRNHKASKEVEDKETKIPNVWRLGIPSQVMKVVMLG